MISPKSYSKEWILSQSKRLGNTGPEILEYALYALSLLEKLSFNKLDFIFKGGTSLMLHFSEIKRLSTDVDIVCKISREGVEEILTKICSESIFSRWELDEERSYSGKIPKAHYFLYFHSNLFDNERYVLLDVLIEKPDYPEIIDKIIDLPILIQDGESTSVRILGINSLLGDKLTAFAPNTIGVTYDSGKHLSMLKQLYDIDLLIDVATNFPMVSETFKISAQKEIDYLQENIQIGDVYSDILKTSFLLASGFLNKLNDKESIVKYQVFVKGLAALNSFLPGRKRFTRFNVLLAASRSAYITSIIQTGKLEEFKLFDNSIQVDDYLFPEKPDNQFNKLSKLPGGVLYYLKQAYDLTK
ncbi:MAG: nucleotidyl transferase AbiEii/AbiGii toxin family protein [Bacteroidales bacterium]|nr:nucleotidyl transferase AbiEii/AbiGii toxin family protein [Bacteroidales bacterium]